MPDVDGLIEFLVRDKGFRFVSSRPPPLPHPLETDFLHSPFDSCSEDRVRAGASKLAKGFNAKQQGRLDSFFKVLPKDPSKEASSSKKKADEKKGGAKRKVRRRFQPWLRCSFSSSFSFSFRPRRVELTSSSFPFLRSQGGAKEKADAKKSKASGSKKK